MNSLIRMSIEHSIEERRRIIEKHRATGVLDRSDAISKIMELRYKDSKVLDAEMAEMVSSGKPIPLDRATDEQIINQLRTQVDALMAELWDG